jgi:hypothetical protein
MALEDLKNEFEYKKINLGEVPGIALSNNNREDFSFFLRSAYDT